MSATLEPRERLATLWQPRPRHSLPDYADQYLYLGRGVSAFSKDGPARFRSSIAPHQIEPQKAFHDPTVQMTVLNGASQVFGKTRILSNLIAYHMHWQPANMVMMYPIVDAAEKFASKKLMPDIEATPALREVLNRRTSKILVKDFLGGCLYLVGANSTTSLRGTSGQVLIADEIDDYPDDIDGQGDPLELLWKRGESYPNVIKVVSSTPTLEGTSRIDALLNESDYHRWMMPCPKCGGRQYFKWEQFIIPDKDPLKIFIECQHCNAQLNDADRLSMYYAGKWEATQPFNGIRGYHFPGMNCPWPAQKGYRDRLHQMGVEYLRSLKKESRHKVFVNTFECRTWKIKAKKLEARPLMNRAEDYGPMLPAGVLALVAACDVQDDRLEAAILGYGIGEECWWIEYRVIMGDPDIPTGEPRSPWDGLDDFFMSAFDHPSGTKLRVECALVDMGHKPRAVLRFTKPRQFRRIYACAGSKTPWAPLLSRPKKSTIKRATTFIVGGDTAKEILFTRLGVEQPGPRYIHFPKGRGFDEEFYAGLVAERLQEHTEDGIVTKRQWVKIRQRNEPLDIGVYALGALEKLNVNFEALAKSLQVSPEKISNANRPGEVPPKTNEPTPRQPWPVKRPQSGFVGRWKIG